MECPFKIGDEVECIDDRPAINGCPDVEKGRQYIIHEVSFAPLGSGGFRHGWGVRLEGLYYPERGPDSLGRPLHAAVRFKKVQRRNDRLTIEAFSVIKDGFEEPKRTPAPAKRERAQ